jgi:cell division protein FtsB
MQLAALALAYILQLAFFAVPVLLLVALWRFLRAYERRSSAHNDLATLSRRISQMEERIADLETHNESLVEEQRFLTNLLSERHAETVSNTKRWVVNRDSNEHHTTDLHRRALLLPQLSRERVATAALSENAAVTVSANVVH